MAHVLTSLMAIFMHLPGPMDLNERGSGVVKPATWEVCAEAEHCARIWIFFTDKGVESPVEFVAALRRVESGYHPRAIKRRLNRRTSPGLFDVRDIPVCERYVEQVTRVGARVRIRSHWLNAISAETTTDQVRRIAELPFVRSIEPVRRGVRTDVVPISPGKRPEVAHPRGGFHGLTEPQLAQIGVLDMHSAGFTGAGVVIGVLDTGFIRTHEVFNQPDHPLDVVAEWDFVDGDPDAGQQSGDPGGQNDHGTIVLATIGGFKPSTYVAAAYDASYILAKTEDTTQEVPAEEDQYVAGLQFIEANGGDVATSSLGYIDWYDYYDMDGLTAVTTLAINIATSNGLVCCTAAGNGGFDQDLPSLIAPGDAFEVITCGAVDITGNLADFSSNGPTADGRTKPEVMARGVHTDTVDVGDDAGYGQANGTSLSTPLVASAVALLIQAHPTWTVQQIRTALFETADYYVAHGVPDPDSHVGYGIIDVFTASQRVFCLGSPACAGDLNCDDIVDFNDVALFAQALADPEEHIELQPGCPILRADFNDDGEIDGRDTSGFVSCLLDGTCP